MILKQHVRPCQMVPTAPIQDLTSTFTISPSSQPKEQVPKPASSLPLQNKSVSNTEFGVFFLFIYYNQADLQRYQLPTDAGKWNLQNA